MLLFLYGIWVGITTMLSAHGTPGTLGLVMFLFMLFCFLFGYFLKISAQKTKEYEELESEILDQIQNEEE
jgi:hypothetical protein